MIRISVVGPVLNEVDFIGYSIMAALPYVHEFVYALDEKSDDGTRELLHHIKERYAHEKLIILDHPTFHPHDMRLYNGAFNRCLDQMTGEAAFFLHPDMIITEFQPPLGMHDPIGDAIKWENSTAWWVQMTSYAGDLKTVITKGRTDKWKNIHKKTMGLHYFGGYGSQNEDFYHSDITGKSYKHYGSEFSKYPYQVMNSGIKVNHYCEAKAYRRRFEKMVLCLKTLYPNFTEDRIKDMAAQHPRVTLESSSNQFGHFEFTESNEKVPDVFATYKDTFDQFKKELIYIHG